MKRIFILAISIGAMTTLMWGCNKRDGKKSVDDGNNIQGTWELRQTSAAMNPSNGQFPPGNGNLLKFIGDQYQVYKDGQIIKEGKFQVVADTTVEKSVCLILPKNEFITRIIYDGDQNEPKHFLHIAGSKLEFISGCYADDSGHREQYEKLVSQ